MSERRLALGKRWIPDMPKAYGQFSGCAALTGAVIALSAGPAQIQAAERKLCAQAGVNTQAGVRAHKRETCSPNPRDNQKLLPARWILPFVVLIACTLSLASSANLALAQTQPFVWSERGLLIRAMARNVPSAEFYRLVDEGNAAANKGEHGAALQHYTNALSLGAPNRRLESITLRLRAIALRGLRRLPEAIEDSDRAVTLAPNDPLAYLGRANIFATAKRYEVAVQDYDRYLAHASNDASAYRGKGIALQGLGKHTEAREAYDQAIKIAPNYASAYLNRAQLWSDLGEHAAAAADYSRASADYSRAIEIRPTADAYYGRGVSKHQLHEFEAALVDYGRAIELNPKHISSYVNRGNIYRNLKRYEQALADYDTALKLDPSHLNVYRNRGWLHEQWGQPDRAQGYYEQGLRLSPNDEWLQGAVARLRSAASK
jgi:tetratricopeptide (TPR) repeat protein